MSRHSLLPSETEANKGQKRNLQARVKDPVTLPGKFTHDMKKLDQYNACASF